jgi:hypothetical protein
MRTFTMKPSCRLLAIFVIASFSWLAGVSAQDHSVMPSGMTHEQHMMLLKQHGQMAMGFDQDKAQHHFTLTANGGIIQVTALDPADQVTEEAIQKHLQQITVAFGRGDFEKPLMTHGEVPPGVSAMQGHKDEITYTYEPLKRGGLVRIATSNADALDAIHDFLKYQIREHATGDPTTVQQ